jgi:uncharacterized protein
LRLALDTNVLIAAFVARGTCSELLEHVASNHTVICSEYILEEFKEKLIEKFAIPISDTRRAVALLRERFEVVVPADVPEGACPDEGDLPILGTAAAGNCACLITGDRELLALGSYEEIRILSPAEFWKQEDQMDRAR